jgi:hypothetical protein
VSTFWPDCGAIWRVAILQIRSLDQSCRRSSLQAIAPGATWVSPAPSILGAVTRGRFLRHLERTMDWQRWEPMVERPRRVGPRRGCTPHDWVAVYEVLRLLHLYLLSERNADSLVYDSLPPKSIMGSAVGDVCAISGC